MACVNTGLFVKRFQVAVFSGNFTSFLSDNSKLLYMYVLNIKFKVQIMGTALVEHVCVPLTFLGLLVTVKRLKKRAGIITG